MLFWLRNWFLQGPSLTLVTVACLHGMFQFSGETIARDWAREDARQEIWSRIPFGLTNERVQTGLRNGVSIDCRKEDGGTYLIAAAEYGNPQSVQVLLDNGADPNATNDAGESALTVAVHLHHTRVVQLLRQQIKHGKPGATKEAEPEHHSP